MNKKVLVTGSSRGIGESIGKVFTQKNWDVCFTSRNKDDLTELQQKFPNSNHLFEQVDFTNLHQIEKLYNIILKKWGYLNSIVINVGSGSGEKTLRSSYKNNSEVYKQNFYSAYFSSMLLSSLLKKSKDSSLTFIGSIAANVNVQSPINYALAKKAVENLGINLSIKLSNYSIRVNVIHPGHTLTHGGYWEKKKLDSAEDFRNFIDSRTLVKDIIQTEEIANFVYNVTYSNFSQKLTGTVYILDAGSSRIK